METRLSFPVDSGSQKKAIAALKDIDKRQSALKITTDKVTKSAGLEGRALTRAAKASTSNIAKAVKSQQGLTTEIGATIRAAKELEIQTDRNTEAFDKASKSVALAGDVQSNLAAIRSLAETAGLGGVAGGIGVGGEIIVLLEELPRLKTSLAGLPAVAQSAAKSLGLTGLTGSLQAAIPALGATGASIAAMTAVALPAVIAIGAVIFAVKQYSKAAEEQAEILSAVIDAQRDVNQEIAQGLTSAEAGQQIEELTRAREAEEQTLASLEGAYASFESQLSETFGILGGPVTAGIKLFDSREQELFDSIQEGNSAIAGYDATIAALTHTLDRGELAANDATEALEDLAVAQEELLAERTQIFAKREQAQQRQTQLSEQQAKSRLQFAATEARTEEDRTIRQERLLEDRALRFEAHQATLEQIEMAGNQRIEELRGELAALPGERSAALVEAEQTGRDKQQEIDAKFFADNQKLITNFRKQETNTERKFSKQRRRFIDDLSQRLDEAQQANNVIAFLQAQADGQKQLRRQAEDAGDEEQRRTEQFISAQNRITEQRAKQTRQTLAGIETERQKINETFNERRQAIADSIDAEKSAIAERTAVLEASYAKELQRQQLQDQRREEDFQREDQRRQSLHDQQMANLREQTLQAIALRNVLGAQAIQNVATEDELLTRQAQLSGVSPFSPIQSFGHGGIVTKKQLAIVGEVPEAIIPLSKLGNTDGLPRMPISSGGRGSTSITFAPQLNTTVGDIASKAEVTAAFRDYAEISMRELHRWAESVGMIA